MHRKLRPKLKQITLKKLMKVEVFSTSRLLILKFLMHGLLELNLHTISRPKLLIESKELRALRSFNGNLCKKKKSTNKMLLTKLRKPKSRRSPSNKKERRRRQLKPLRKKLNLSSRLPQKLKMLMKISRISILMPPRIRMLCQRLIMKMLLQFPRSSQLNNLSLLRNQRKMLQLLMLKD